MYEYLMILGYLGVMHLHFIYKFNCYCSDCFLDNLPLRRNNNNNEDDN